MDKIDYREFASKLFCWVVFAILGIVFFKYFFRYIIPFLIAWGIAYLVYPTANKLSAKTKLPRKVCSFVLVLLLLTVILLLLFWIVNRLAFEIQNLVEYMTNNTEAIAGYFEQIFDFLGSIGERLPIINKFQDEALADNITANINSFISSIWKSLLESLGNAVPNLAGKIVMTLPEILFVSLITVVACFYFAVDIDLIHIKLKGILPNKIAGKIQKFKDRAGRGIKKYLKAYIIIFIITFVELFVGFLVLGVDYSFVLALLIAIIDFLPVFGTGVVLVPWGIILLLMKNYFLGIGILILLLMVTIVRQIIEPKIVGKSMGVHPLLTLLTIYIGFKLFGIFGMILLPIVVPIVFYREESKEG